MQPRSAARVVYAAGVAQGIALVTFPAASTILTDPSEYGLSSSEYGALFVPQALMAIAASLLGAAASRRTRALYVAGLAANFAAMATLLATSAFPGGAAAYPLLLLATACLGIGFGLTVPALNTLTAALHPGRVDGSVLVLNALLGVGTALAPALVAAFVGIGAWWALPALTATMLAALVPASARVPAPVAAPAPEAQPRRAGLAIPRRFWIYAAFALTYGVCETMNGNWAQLDMTTDLGATTTEASLALTAFWASVTAGRLLFAALARRVPIRHVYHALPFGLAATFLVTATLSPGDAVIGIAVFALAGLGCSALLPLTITFGQEELTGVAAAATAGVIAFYQIGYGIAAFGVGPLKHADAELSTLFGATAAVALVMGVLALVVAPRGRDVTRLHPRPPSHHAVGA